MKPAEQFKQMVEAHQNDPEYVVEGVLIDINEQLVRLMARLNLNKSQLATRLGVSNAYVTKLLRGNENLTLKQLVRIVVAMDSRIDVAVVPANATIHRMFRYVSQKMQIEDYRQPVVIEENYEPDCSIAA